LKFKHYTEDKFAKLEVENAELKSKVVVYERNRKETLDRSPSLLSFNSVHGGVKPSNAMFRTRSEAGDSC